ncbi:MAG: hypothetical protein LBC81_02765 [Tannerellaceae bacterium]|jgi:uncharacterized protein YcfL|nr:hypothetical protein [Tannerellaceae bacterium]
MKAISVIILLSFLLIGCSTPPTDYTLVFTLESVSNYKLTIEIDSRRNYTLRRQNLYFDAHSNSENVYTATGSLTSSDASTIEQLIASAHIFRLNDSYGFDEDASSNNPFDDILYQIIYTERRRTKNITARFDPNLQYPKQLTALITFLSLYASEAGRQ